MSSLSLSLALSPSLFKIPYSHPKVTTCPWGSAFVSPYPGHPDRRFGQSWSLALCLTGSFKIPRKIKRLESLYYGMKRFNLLQYSTSNIQICLISQVFRVTLFYYGIKITRLISHFVGLISSNISPFSGSGSQDVLQNR